MKPLLRSTLLCVALLLPLTQQATAAAGDNTAHTEFRVLLWPRLFSPDYTGAIEAQAAQEAASDDGASPPPPNAPVLYFLSNGTTPVPLHLKDGSFSHWSRYQGPPQLHFYTRIPPAEAPLPAAAASVNMPIGRHKMLLIFFPVTAASYRIVPMPYPFDSLQPDEAVVMNLSKSTVRCTLGGETFTLNPGESITQKPHIIDGYLEAIVIARRTDGNRWRREILRKYPRHPDKHALFIIFPRGSGKSGLDLLRLGVDGQ